MRLYMLNKGLTSPCMVLKMKDITIMLDCHLDLSSLLHYLPTSPVSCEKREGMKQWTSADVKQTLGTETNLYEIAGRSFVNGIPEVCYPESALVDFSSVDVILISNFYNILALPYITEYCGFEGKVLATEPTLQLGRLLMEDLVTHNKSFQQRKKVTQWKSKDIQKFLPYPLNECHDAMAWQAIYNEQDVANSVAKIQAVGFSEKIDILGLIKVTAVSSGYTIGASNWLVETDFHKICYISATSLYATHSLPMEQSAIKNADVFIMNGLTPSSTVNPDAMVREFCSHLAVSLKNGGNALVPCVPSGVIYDLLEYLCSFMDGSGLSTTPIYFISPVADSSLAYANIYAEWLNGQKQAKMYLPEPPFLHEELVKSGRVKHHPNIHSVGNNFKSPCIMFCGHPSLRFGDAVHMMNLWKKQQNNTVIFIDSEFPYIEALMPYQPMSMKAVYCPIDPRLNFHQANKVLRESKPRLLLIPQSYQTPPPNMPQRNDLTINTDIPTQTVSHLDVLEIPLHKDFAKVTLSPEIAKNLSLKQIDSNLAVSLVKGRLVTRDNRHTLKPLDGDKNKSSPRLFGSINIDQFLRALEKQGIHNAVAESTESGHIVHFTHLDAMIQLENGSTHIINHTSEKMRVQIKEALLTCLVQV